MITRIVKMTFKDSSKNEFKEFVKNVVNVIRSFDGCEHVEILNDIHNDNVFFTYSYWKSEEYLNKYRKSEFFIKTWSKTKQWFMEKPEAWSFNKII